MRSGLSRAGAGLSRCERPKGARSLACVLDSGGRAAQDSDDGLIHEADEEALLQEARQHWRPPSRVDDAVEAQPWEVHGNLYAEFGLTTGGWAFRHEISWSRVQRILQLLWRCHRASGDDLFTARALQWFPRSSLHIKVMHERAYSPPVVRCAPQPV